MAAFQPQDAPAMDDFPGVRDAGSKALLTTDNRGPDDRPGADRDSSLSSGGLSSVVSSQGQAAFIPELEAVRGLAIALVFSLHTDAWVAWRQPAPGLVVPLWQAFVFAGQTGVSLFFVLSAFLLSRPFLLEAAGGRRVDRSAYYARRALRILPLYWAAVVVSTLLWARSARQLLNGAAYLVFLNTFPGTVEPMKPFSGGWWSLATEVQFYLLLPALPFFLRSKPQRWLGSIVLGGFAAVYAAVVLGWLHPSSPEAQLKTWHSLFCRAPLFLCGIAASWLYVHYGPRLRGWAYHNRWVCYGGADCALVLVVLGLGVCLRRVVSLTYMGAESQWQTFHVFEGLLWAAFLLLILLAPAQLRRLLVNRFWEKIGMLSYSIYLIHSPFILYTFVWLGGWLHLAPGWNARSAGLITVLSAICIGLATITYYGIERPFLRRKARLGWWRSEPG